MLDENLNDIHSGLIVAPYKDKNIYPLMGLLYQEFPNWSGTKIRSYMDLVLSKENTNGGVLIAQNEALYYVGVLVYSFQKINFDFEKNIESTKKTNIIVIENLIASSPVLQKQVFMSLINSSIKIGKNHSCEYIELPNFENGHLQLLELKYANKIIKEGIRTYIKL